jgi:DNA repair protein RecN (Recombination protein N)
MIDELLVENVALIKQAHFTPSSRLTVITGETGAGKTALISATQLLMGARADSSLVRSESEGSRVQGRFYSAANEDEELVVTRSISPEGRSRATLNGSLASLAELSQAIRPLVDLCGQHEYQSLLKTSEHGRILDTWAKLGVKAAVYHEAYSQVQDALNRLEEIKAAQNASQVVLDEARFTLKQIEAVRPLEGEYEELKEWLARAENAESLVRNSAGAAEALSGDGGTLDTLSHAIALIEEASRDDATLAPYAESLKEASYIIEDVARDMSSYASSIEFNEQQLVESQERMGALRGLIHSFGPTMEEVFKQWHQAQETLNLADNAGEALEQAQKEVDAAEKSLDQAAQTYHEARVAAAPEFSKAVGAILTQLDMGTAELICNVEPLPRKDYTSTTCSSVLFTFKPGKAMQARPLTRIASGGEVSRVLLAIKVVLGAQDGTETLIFDEVDAGVGGNTAYALARVLNEAAQTHQVIVITHLAQIAAFADTHYKVSKTKGDSPETLLEEVSDGSRVEEIARLLSGTETKASLAHAQELLNAAQESSR